MVKKSEIDLFRKTGQENIQCNIRRIKIKNYGEEEQIRKWKKKNKKHWQNSDGKYDDDENGPLPKTNPDKRREREHKRVEKVMYCKI